MNVYIYIYTHTHTHTHIDTCMHTYVAPGAVGGGDTASDGGNVGEADPGECAGGAARGEAGAGEGRLASSPHASSGERCAFDSIPIVGWPSIFEDWHTIALSSSSAGSSDDRSIGSASPPSCSAGLICVCVCMYVCMNE